MYLKTHKSIRSWVFRRVNHETDGILHMKTPTISNSLWLTDFLLPHSLYSYTFLKEFTSWFAALWVYWFYFIVDYFPASQYYSVFEFSDGGESLESYSVSIWS